MIWAVALAREREGLPEAIKEYQAALRLNPNFEDAQENLRDAQRRLLKADSD